MQVRGAPGPVKWEFLGATDLGTRSVLALISVQNHFFESELVLAYACRSIVESPFCNIL
jgi:hypothetical protein